MEKEEVAALAAQMADLKVVAQKELETLEKEVIEKITAMIALCDAADLTFKINVPELDEYIQYGTDWNSSSAYC